jgi:serine/threonine protein phosphatase PrpC
MKVEEEERGIKQKTTKISSPMKPGKKIKAKKGGMLSLKDRLNKAVQKKLGSHVDDQIAKHEEPTVLSMNDDPIDISLSGTSATIVIQTPKVIICAYVGDSNCVIGS